MLSIGIKLRVLYKYNSTLIIIVYNYRLRFIYYFKLYFIK